MKLFRIFRLCFYATFILATALGYFTYIDTLSKPLKNRETVLVIPQGVGISWLARHLEDQGIIDNRYVFRAYTWLNMRNVNIKAGEYTLVDVDSIPDLVSKVDQGKVIQYTITLIEGKTYKEYIAQLTSQRVLVDEIQDMSGSDVMRELGAPGMHPEGWFAPQTYYFQKGDSDLDVLKQAYSRQKQLLDRIWETRADHAEVKSAYQLLTLASIIEKETGVAAERPTIAGVFNNRLRIGMKLQTDPTVIYGMGDSYQGNIRRSDLTTDTPHNTYTRYGLPPTPIAMPGEASIQAAANPEFTEALFFVGKGDGSHQFSKTLQEHNNAVTKYQLRGRAKNYTSSPKESN
ncbi:endolytic transglycosylase MltG [Arenicella xantha]|uniref:Endolytic murein transglycosylase n=1 Tax=Arenicella xantha TaxID=644221 RepID=A0A395JHQ8_9GAMM|nr:endolytic transglycosylase MltG [Arenicella xantha]RBP48413.1 UPF0755 protein [Arenicella xantha]